MFTPEQTRVGSSHGLRSTRETAVIVVIWLACFPGGWAGPRILSADVGDSNNSRDKTAPRPSDRNWTRYRFREVHMGVDFTLQFYAEDRSHANTAATAAFAEVAKLNKICSDYDPNSELMTLCRAASPDRKMPISPDLAIVLRLSSRFAEQTNSAFDITVGPVVKLWRTARRTRSLPPPMSLKQALQSVGMQNLQIDEHRDFVRLKRKAMRLDLGGIAKGYAGDVAIDTLRQHGIRRAMVDASGDIVVGDAPPHTKGWKIQLSELDGNASSNNTSPPKRMIAHVCLSNVAIATSGDLFQFVEIDGVRYSHIVNPRTGIGVKTRSQVTVIAPTGAAADAYASAISVLGPTGTRQTFKHRPEVAWRILIAKPTDYKGTLKKQTIEMTQSPTFQKYYCPAIAESSYRQH